MADFNQNKRLKKIITEVYKVSPVEFSKKYRDPKAVKTYNILSERNGISTKMLDEILTAYPEINKVWLLTGEGPMLIENTNSPNTSQEPINQNQNDMNIELVKMIDRKDREIGELQATIANLREEIGALRTKLESMTFVESQSQKKGAV